MLMNTPFVNDVAMAGLWVGLPNLQSLEIKGTSLRMAIQRLAPGCMTGLVHPLRLVLSGLRLAFDQNWLQNATTYVTYLRVTAILPDAIYTDWLMEAEGLRTL